MEKREIREGLLHAERARKQLIRPKLQELGLTPGQGQVGILNRLLQRPNLSQRELADLCHLDVTTMSRTLDKLQKQGLIIRERDPDCRRSCRISLTEEGREKAEAVRIGFAEIEQMICSGFREEEIRQLAGQLLRIKENLLSEGESEQENE